MFSIIIIGGKNKVVNIIGEAVLKTTIAFKRSYSEGYKTEITKISKLQASRSSKESSKKIAQEIHFLAFWMVNTHFNSF